MSKSLDAALAARDAVATPRTVRGLRQAGAYAFWYVPAVLVGLLFMAPFAWAITSSLKGPTELFDYPPRFLPTVPMWQNYAIIWSYVPLLTFIENSFLIGILATVGQAISAAM